MIIKDKVMYVVSIILRCFFNFFKGKVMYILPILFFDLIWIFKCCVWGKEENSNLKVIELPQVPMIIIDKIYTISIILSCLFYFIKGEIMYDTYLLFDFNSNHRVCEPPQVSMKIIEKVSLAVKSFHCFWKVLMLSC